MDTITIQGKTPLSGTIAIGGAKNGALKALAAALLSEEKMSVTNVPTIEDMARQVEVLEHIGAAIEWDKDDHSMTIDTSGVKGGELDSESFTKIRGGMALTGPLLARFGSVSFPEPGGCSFGKRPIDRFLKGFEALGANVVCDEGVFTISSDGRLKGADIIFPEKSVVATETLMMAAVMAEGETRLINAACEPEVPNLAEYLNNQGAKIAGAGTDTITIEGVESLGAGEFNNIPDRLEAAFFAIAAVATKGTVEVTDCIPEHLEVLLEILKEMGAGVTWSKDTIKITPVDTLINLPKVKTSEYPGLNTDMQPFLTTLLTQATGQVLVFETIHEGRLNVVDSLNKMGANITVFDPHRVQVEGPTDLKAAGLVCLDARTANAFVLAGLIAEGETTLSNIYQLERGFESLPKRLNSLGAKIT